MSTNISIITTAFKPEFLKDTLSSIEAIINEPLNIKFELVFLNDSGKQEIYDVWNKYVPKDIDCTYLDFGQNFGRKKALNIAIEKAKYEWIFVLDDDDIILQRTLYNFATAIQANQNTNWFVADFLRMDENRRYLIGQDYYSWNFNSAEDMLKSIFKGDHFIQFNTIFKKELFNKVGCMDENFAGSEDIDLYTRFLLHKEMPIYVNFVSHIHRFHTKNASQGMTKDVYLKTHLQSLKDKFNTQFKILLDK